MSKSTRLWAFRFGTAIVLPLLVLVAMEAALFLVGYGHSAKFAVPCRVSDRDAYCDNDRFTWQFFPAGAFRLPLSFAFPAEKPAGTFRIFVIGESAAQGDPDPSFSFSRYLEVMLRERFKTTHFEIVNAGITAVNSHVLLPLVRDLARHEADLFVIYTGNNEVVGPFGAGNTFTPNGSSLALIRSGVALKSTRVGQLIGDALRPRSTQAMWHGMETFLDQQVPADSPKLTNVYENFEANLREIVGSAQESGAHVLLSTVGVNLKDNAPFASAHRETITESERDAWDAAVKDARSLEAGEQHAEALKRYLAAAAIDDRHAELQFRIARAMWSLGDFEKARERFTLARNLDVLRFRADDQINDIIRSVAKELGPESGLLDTEATFAAESANGSPGREFFYDHVHMSPHGNYLIARDLLPRVAGMLPKEARDAAGPDEPPPAEEAERLLAMTPFDRLRIAATAANWMSQPPFTNQLNHEEELRLLRSGPEAGSTDFESTAQTYRSAIGNAPGDRWLHFNFGNVLEQVDPAAAAAEFKRALDLLPGDYGARQKLAETMIRMGNFEAGIDECRTLLSEKPYHAPAYFTMAFALAQLQRFDESIAAYEQAMRYHPGYTVTAYNMIGLIQISQKKYDSAAATLQKAVDLNVAEAAKGNLLYNLSVALKRAGRAAEAQNVLTAMAKHEEGQRRASSPVDPRPTGANVR